MSGKNRLPSKLLKISEIHEGTMQDMGDRKYFLLDSNPIHKVRVYGTVIERRDFPKTESTRERTILRIDDGTDTISMTVWSYPTREDGEVVSDPIRMVDGIKIGDIIDVLGRVRDFNDEFFINPYSIGKKDGLEWEIHRRSQLVQRDLENKRLLIEERPIEELLDFSENIETASNELTSSIRNEVLQLMADNGKYSRDQIAELLEYDLEEIGPVIKKLNDESFIMETGPGKYQIVP